MAIVTCPAVALFFTPEAISKVCEKVGCTVPGQNYISGCLLLRHCRGLIPKCCLMNREK